MSASLIDGKAMAAAERARLRERVEALRAKGVEPGIKETDVAECVGYFKGLMKAAEG